MITFIPDQHCGWEIVTMKEELELIFNRPIDLVTKKAIENSKNHLRKKEILESYQVIYRKAEYSFRTSNYSVPLSFSLFLILFNGFNTA